MASRTPSPGSPRRSPSAPRPGPPDRLPLPSHGGSSTPLRQFTLGKSFDTFAPLGPCIASLDGIDLADIRVRTAVSGELMQDASTRDLIFPVLDLIVYLSAGVTLEPGDVIATGTPGGVGDSRQPPRYLREGDVVEVTVDGVGTLRNPVRLER